MYDFIVVGQGIAGTILAWFLHKAGKKVLVIDEYRTHSSSLIAAGVTNPVTGRRLVKTWLADKLIPFAALTYNELETLTGKRFYEPLRIVRLFNSIKEQNDWSARCAMPEYTPYLDNAHLTRLDENYVINPFGGFDIEGGSKLDMEAFLTAMRGVLRANESVWEERFLFHDLTVTDEEVTYRGVKAGMVIFADGAQATQNPFFSFLPFQPAKGERLLIEIENFPYPFMLKSDVLLVPNGAPHQYYVGATHENHFENEQPTEKGLEELTQGLGNLLKCPYRIVDHAGAIRPAVKGRRPLIGVHPQYKRVGLFNGMGTKGVSLAPYFAQNFTAHLLQNETLVPEVDIKRFV